MFNQTLSTLNNIQTQFSIKDLENLSGVLAHTLRIWEKRYNLLEPMRTDSNIRMYCVNDLQNLLTVSSLYHQGYKISHIAHMSVEERNKRVRELMQTSKDVKLYEADVKLAMMTFDRYVFETVYEQMLKNLDFSSVFRNVFIPLLINIGIEWQSQAITPAHEHFLSNLIMQKLYHNIDLVSKVDTANRKVFALFLPLNEIHELGLLYLHYELLKHGKYSIYLGSSVPDDNLYSIQSVYDHVQFVSYFTIKPGNDDLSSYLNNFSSNILVNGNALAVTGRKLMQEHDQGQDNIQEYPNLKEMLEHLIKE